MELRHFSHEHPLVFIQEPSTASEEEEEDHCFCFGCDELVDGPSYCCKECKFYLHKHCAELELAPQINHPFHPKHVLTLLPKSPYGDGYGCDFCGRGFRGFVYHCDSCQFDLDINCALLHTSIAENFPNSLHEHSLIVVQNHNEEVEYDCAAGCKKPLSGPIYHCSDCDKFYLHKECVKLSLEINHPFHPKHLLTLSPKSLYKECDFCGREFRGLFYRCDSCRFDLDINCALLHTSIAENFPNSLHKHPLIFVQDHKEEVEYDCAAGCKKSLSGPIYHCLDCDEFYLHKECAELPLEINHPSNSKHTLALLPNPPSHPEECCCYLCKIKWNGFVYCCSLCKVELTLEDVFAPPTITDESHEHPWTLMPRQMSFICDFCGTSGDRTPYVCTTCGLLVHKNCIPLPCNIMLTRHDHVISHSYCHQQKRFENWNCRICHEEVNTRYGCYYCSTSECNFIAHSNCATDKEIWDGKIILNDIGNDKSSDEGNLITNVIEEISIGEDMVAKQIKHLYHDHNLILSFSGEIKYDNNCDGCMGPISIPFYSCDQCKFFLHKTCAELPRIKRHSFHKHSLTLTNDCNRSNSSICRACNRPHHGFRYCCREVNCWFSIDVQCSLLSDTLKHPSHEHLLFLVHKYRGKCNGCLKQMYASLAYKCVKRCDFALDIHCATLPLTAWYKYDRHSLSLTHFDDSSHCQHYCDLCEKERDPNRWFYYCANCDNSLHPNCVLGDLPFIKLGSELENTYSHPHPLAFVKNIWNCPPCKVCGELCNGQTLECKESECNSSFHWSCFWRSRSLVLDLRKSTG